MLRQSFRSLPALAVVAVVVAGVSNQACNLFSSDPCNCYDVGGGASPDRSVTQYSCDGNTLVVSSAPECGAGCNTPTITRSDCGAQTCVSRPESAPYGPANSCSTSCNTDVDCGGGGNACVRAVRWDGASIRVCVPPVQSGGTCIPGPGNAQCAPGLSCLPVQPDSTTPSDDAGAQTQDSSLSTSDASHDDGSVDTDASSDDAAVPDASPIPVDPGGPNQNVYYTCQ